MGGEILVIKTHTGVEKMSKRDIESSDFYLITDGKAGKL